MTPLPYGQSERILWDVVEEHFEEAEFLFGQWKRSLNSPMYTLEEIGANIERRLEAHLDGLAIGGTAVASRILQPELGTSTEPSRTAVAALGLLLMQEEESASRVIQLAITSEGILQQVLGQALVLARSKILDRMLLERLRTELPDFNRALLLQILTRRGVDVGDLLNHFSKSENQDLLVSVLDAAGRFSRAEMFALSERHLRANEVRLRSSAMKTSLVLGCRKAWELCRQWAHEPGAQDVELFLLIAILGGEEDHKIFYEGLENASRARQMLWFLGFCGTIQAGEACLSRLESKDEREAKAAWEAMAWIAGFDLNEKRFQGTAVEPSEEDTLPRLEDDDLNADLCQGGLDDIPVPKAEVIAQCWRENIQNMTPNQRYMLGRPQSSSAMAHALRKGSLWRRHAIALELAIRTGGRKQVSTDAFSCRQRIQLAALSENETVGHDKTEIQERP